VSTRFRFPLVLPALVLFAIGCSESTAVPSPAGVTTDLVGRWVSPHDDLSPESWAQRSLTFTIDGRFTSESRMYGLYAGQQRDALSAFSRTEGRYHLERDRLVFDPQRLVWWDRFDGAGSAEHIEQPYPWGGLFDDARFSVHGDHFEMTYTVYPADAAVQVITGYTRDR
jgi:hypothetical protein